MGLVADKWATYTDSGAIYSTGENAHFRRTDHPSRLPRRLLTSCCFLFKTLTGSLRRRNCSVRWGRIALGGKEIGRSKFFFRARLCQKIESPVRLATRSQLFPLRC